MFKKLACAALAVSLVSVPVIADDDPLSNLQEHIESIAERVGEAVEVNAEDYLEEEKENIIKGILKKSVRTDTSSTEIKNGILTIYIDGREEGHWEYEIPKESIVELLTDSDMDGHTYVGSFRGIGDGEEDIILHHYIDNHVDKTFGFIVNVMDGEITEVIGGFSVDAPDAKTVIEELRGEWEGEDAKLEFVKPVGDSIMVKLTNDGVVHELFIDYDCKRECFVYDGGIFSYAQSDGDLAIDWDSDAGEHIRFVRNE